MVEGGVKVLWVVAGLFLCSGVDLMYFGSAFCVRLLCVCGCYRIAIAGIMVFIGRCGGGGTHDDA